VTGIISGMRSEFRWRNEGAYVLLIALMVLARVLLLLAELDPKNRGQQLALAWWFPLAIAAFGVPGVVLGPKAGFPHVYPAETSGKRWLVTLILGFTTGILSSAVDWVKPLAPQIGLSSLHHALPEAVPFYFYGAVISEIVYHLTPVVLVVFLVSRLLPEEKRTERTETYTFWCALLVLSAWEQKDFFLHPQLWSPIEIARNLVSYLANAIEIYLLRKWGFAMAVTQRLASYSIWHIAWPAMSGV
jgi:hypothetical protein